MSDLNKVYVVPVVLLPHENADTLSLVEIDGYTVVVRTEDWKNEDRGIYIPPDNVVDITREEFKWLDTGIIGQTKVRIKAKKLRGIMSQGLLIPVPKGVSEITVTYSRHTGESNVSTVNVPLYEIGAEVSEQLGITRYVSAEDVKLEQGEAASGPPNPGSKYDIESWFKYKKSLPEGTQVVITEKLHGSNARFTFQEGEMYVGSRSFWRKYSTDNLYWKVLDQNYWIRDFCTKFPGAILYGEIFGWVQSLKYGAKPGEVHFRAFDVFDNNMMFNNMPNSLTGFWHWNDLYDQVTEDGKYHERLVPILAYSEISDTIVNSLISGKSTIYPGHLREGIVIKPVMEKFERHFGRVILKAVSPEYLEKA